MRLGIHSLARPSTMSPASEQPFTPCGKTRVDIHGQLAGAQVQWRADTKDATCGMQEDSLIISKLFADALKNMRLQRPRRDPFVVMNAPVQTGSRIREANLVEGEQQYEQDRWLRFPARLHPALLPRDQGDAVSVKTVQVGASSS